MVQVKKVKVLVKAGQPFQQKAAKDAMQKTEAAGAEPQTSSSSKEKDPSRPANIMFILDASGSMWAEIDGRDKIAIAKEIMAGFIRDLPDNTRAGLGAYGHRRKGDCRDVEELVKIGPINKKTY